MFNLDWSKIRYYSIYVYFGVFIGLTCSGILFGIYIFFGYGVVIAVVYSLIVAYLFAKCFA